MKLPSNFAPDQAASAAGAKTSSFSKLGDGPWTGTVLAGDRKFEVEELASSWKVTDVYAGTSSSGRDLEALLKKVIR